MSAAMLIVLATSNRPTMPYSTERGKTDLTFAILQKRNESHVGRRRRKPEDQIGQEPSPFEPFAPSACGGTALRRNLKRCRRQCAGAARAALTTTRTSTHKDDLCNLNFWEDRPVQRWCKGKNGRKANAHRRRDAVLRMPMKDK